MSARARAGVVDQPVVPEQALGDRAAGGDVVARALDEHRVTGVVHLAGLKAVGESCEKPLDYCDCNVVGTLRLLQAMGYGGRMPVGA